MLHAYSLLHVVLVIVYAVVSNYSVINIKCHFVLRMLHAAMLLVLLALGCCN